MVAGVGHRGVVQSSFFVAYVLSLLAVHVVVLTRSIRNRVNANGS